MAGVSSLVGVSSFSVNDGMFHHVIVCDYLPIDLSDFAFFIVCSYVFLLISFALLVLLVFFTVLLFSKNSPRD